MEKVKLFCLPHAGGSASAYYKWSNYLDSNIEVKPIELSGRGHRITEPLYNSIEEVIDDVFLQVKESIDENTKFAFWGHSMGSLIAYEVCHRIINELGLKPIHIFFSGKEAPQVKKEREILHKLDDEQFLMKIRDMGGTDDEFFNNKELCDLFLPIIKADYKIVENYIYKPKKEVYDFDISVLFGVNDDDFDKDILQWKKQTSSICKFYLFEGGHFYLNDNLNEIALIINKELLK